MLYVIIPTGAVIFIAALIVFLVCPGTRRHKDRRLMQGKAIAHRGLHNVAEGVPENSLGAFRRAADAGLMIENDVHLTADANVIVFHDDTLKRMCGVDGRPEDMTLEELKKLRLGGTDETIPTLKECLDEVAGRVPLLIEFKVSGGNSAALCEAAEKVLSDYEGDYVVQSFYPGVLSWYKKNRPDRMRGQLSTVIINGGIARLLLGTLVSNVATRPDFISYDLRFGGNIFRRLSGLLGGFQAGWTFRSEEELKSKGRHFSAFIFENMPPETVEKYIKERF